MTQFIQLHLLTSYPPANLNRDDLGRPKTARMGGVERLRVSSQSLKRHWRTSNLFAEALSEHLGTRTKRLGREIYDRLTSQGIKDKTAFEWATAIAGQFGKLKAGKKTQDENLEIEQLAHITPEELQGVWALVDQLIAENRAPTDEEKKLLRHESSAVDVSLFGRMLASSPDFNVEAACQVAHAISVHGVAVEDDYFTAVDDLNAGDEDRGASHIGEAAFASALFYLYICIDKDLLVKNLQGKVELANKAIVALVEAAAKVAPKGKQNSFASRAYASYILVEKGAQQPRSLSVAFLKPVRGENQQEDAIQALEQQYKNFDNVYGACADERYAINSVRAEGSFAELTDFITR
ncbi:type I-E CRISPR-associated protein Cas7/Cse4/CasC [Marinospirillum alkaliphilum]|uniref:CRISPR-associated protein, Cse4 family n=1 Tax=Marinospirillum alkaliphilum DSM 21637 TaxID=1122209 RepID=A0A1K1WBM9_9GAMM|nr:type I-E CRISPR-associated protein Cas7/Cse4/CasC [Marinospirillum alkaliphilum]SFX34229.1 CRISPR-associated protein, Cse4 family [Marinospirillum alkaliphilum DSM 21637]